ncbi:MAG: TonB-dependent receptor [Pseudomonadota bacterium]
MKQFTGPSWLMATTALAGLAATMAPVGAAAQDDEVEDTVTVTGSRLDRTDVRGPSPIQTLGDEEIDIRGITRVEELVNTLPAVFVGQTSQVANGATGTSTVNLRGLGATRTLVLLDGRRLPFGSAQAAPANLDLVPAQLVQRVEVTTGGESAIYGADAVAGVVNFILKRDFEGFEIDFQAGTFYDSNDNDFAQAINSITQNPTPTDNQFIGGDMLASILYGANVADGRGNVTLFASYQKQDEIRQGDTDVGSCALGGAAPGPASINGVSCIGSSTFRRFFSAGDTFLSDDGTLVPFNGGFDQTFNFNPDNFYQRPIERFTVVSMANYDITENIEAFADISYVNNNTDAQIAFSGSFFRPFRVNCANPLLDNGLGPNGDGAGTFFDLLGCGPDETTGESPEDVPFVFGWRNVEGDPRNSEIDLTTWRMLGGFRGTLKDNFDWEVFGQYSRTRLVDISTGDLNFERVQDALFAVDDGNGNAVCASGNAGCVPWNVFQRGADGSSPITSAQTDYIQGTGLTTGTTEQTVFGGTISGDFEEYGVVSPFATSGFQALIGFEYRKDSLEFTPDDVSQIPGGRGLTGVGGGSLPIAGSVRATEFFLEASLPLIEDQPGVSQLTVDTAYRFSDYTNTGNEVRNGFDTNTYRLGLRYVPIDDITVRAQYQRAVRAPNVFNLFLGQNTGLFDLTADSQGRFDPCATANPARTFTECARTGVTAAQFGNIPDNPAGQFNSVSGGNPFLDPELADTYTFGVVWQPSQIDGLTISVDYFDITVEEALGTVPPTVSLERCLDTGDSAFCNLIRRDQFGSLFLDNSNFEGVSTQTTNIAELTTTGVDVAVTWNFDPADYGLGGGFGDFSIDYDATFLDSLDTIPLPGETPVECVGFYAGDCGSPNPEYRHRMLTTWYTPFNIDVTGTWRYFGGTEFDGTTDALSQTFDSANYFDLGVRWQQSETFELRGGINNLFDREPNLATGVGTGVGNGNTYPGIYTPVGRFMFIAGTLNF